MSNIIENKTAQKLLLLTASLAMLIDAVDCSVVTLALPPLAADFGIDTGTVSWISMIYSLIIAGTILIFGKIAGNGNIKKVFLTGITLFTIGSFFCVISSGFEILIAARIVQGFGASMMVACIPLICITYLPSAILGAALGLVNALGSVGVVVGPGVGGIFLSALSWHWIFLINIPIGILLIVLAAKLIPKDTACEKQPFDFAGSAFIFLAMVFGVFCIERFPHVGISPLIVVTFALAVIFLLAFILRQLKISFPIINPRVFLSSKFSFVVIAYLLIQIVLVAVNYILPFYFQVEMGYSSFISGLLLLLPAGMAAILCVPFGKLSDKNGRRKYVVAGSLLFIIMSLVFVLLKPEMGLLPILIALVCNGFAFGLCGGPASSRIVDLVSKEDEVTGSNLMMLCIYLGGVLGTAVSASVFTAFTSGIGNGAVAFLDLPADIFMNGYFGVMILMLIFSVLMFVLSFAVKEKKTA